MTDAMSALSIIAESAFSPAIAVAAPVLMLWLIVTLFVLMPCLHLGTRAISGRIAAYRDLPPAKKSTWDQSAAVTMVASTVIFVGMAFVVLRNGGLDAPLDVFDPLPRFVLVFHIAASLYDGVYWYLPLAYAGTPTEVKNASIFLFHHAVVVIMHTSLCLTEKYSIIIAWAGLMDGTGLFLGFFRLQKHMKTPKESPWYAANGIALWISFTLWRVLVPLYSLSRVYITILEKPSFVFGDQPFADKTFLSVGVPCYAVCTLLSFTWYIKITKMVYAGVVKKVCFNGGDGGGGGGDQKRQ